MTLAPFDSIRYVTLTDGLTPDTDSGLIENLDPARLVVLIFGSSAGTGDFDAVVTAEGCVSDGDGTLLSVVGPVALGVAPGAPGYPPSHWWGTLPPGANALRVRYTATGTNSFGFYTVTLAGPPGGRELAALFGMRQLAAGKYDLFPAAGFSK